ncbi:hypothetical protein [Paracoccus aminophilus]|uniref:Uncharacterized protein n=1 Tax=Paracoccus aminophilus JCM 7686 TaxID=1367847 RepID=S5XRE0_PARAH|nr:hypothetical protein [Paracoccus aminophilus]AGT07637.1 hypothetical protein JCM7686_0528 [Paracoccus aminophilus JCM 7686]
MPSLHLLGLAAVLTLAGCVSTIESLKNSPANDLVGQPPLQPGASGEPVVILNNRGGNVVQTIQRRRQLEQSGVPVEVRGYCGSACTLFITMPNACLAPDATVGFHAPRIPNTTIIPPGVDDIMGSYYRNGVLERWNADWKHSLQIQKISAKEYVAADPQTRLCPR